VKKKCWEMCPSNCKSSKRSFLR